MNNTLNRLEVRATVQVEIRRRIATQLCESDSSELCTCRNLLMSQIHGHLNPLFNAISRNGVLQNRP